MIALIRALFGFRFYLPPLWRLFYPKTVSYLVSNSFHFPSKCYISYVTLFCYICQGCQCVRLHMYIFNGWTIFRGFASNWPATIYGIGPIHQRSIMTIKSCWNMLLKALHLTHPIIISQKLKIPCTNHKYTVFWSFDCPSIPQSLSQTLLIDGWKLHSARVSRSCSCSGLPEVQKYA